MALLSVSYGGNAELGERFRRAVGLPDDTVLLPDESIVDAMKSAWSVYRSDFAVRSFGSFQTVAGQQIYDSILPNNSLRLMRVWWPIPKECDRNSLESLERLDNLLSDSLGENKARVLKEPGLVQIALRDLSWLRRLVPGGAQVVGKSKVYLDPVPTSVKTVWFEYADQPAPNYVSLDEHDAEPWFSLVEAKLHERLSSGAGAVVQIRDMEEGTWITTEAAKRHAEMARRKMAAYTASIPPPLPLL